MDKDVKSSFHLPYDGSCGYPTLRRFREDMVALTDHLALNELCHVPIAGFSAALDGLGYNPSEGDLRNLPW